MVNSSTSPRPRLKIGKANLQGRVPINAVYSRHIGSHARLGRSLIYALNPVIQASPNLLLPIVVLSAFYLYRTNFLGATLDAVGRFEVHGAVSADKACPIPMINSHNYGS
jgi:hypothetical protein